MIHGYGGSYRNFYDLAALMKADFRVVRVDLPGFALSDAPAGYDNGEDIVEMYRQFMNDFIPEVVGDTFYVMGNSMGGWMAWEIAADMPKKVKGLVLLCAAGYEMEKVVESVVPFLRFKPVHFLLGRGMPLAVSKHKIKYLYADPSKIQQKSVVAANDLINKEGNLAWMLKLAASGQVPDNTKIITVQAPTLIIWGEKDNLIPYNHASRFERDIKGSRKVVYPDAGHLPMVEQPEKVYADFRKYFNL
jgi:pimeloyl-ACP methyl ester carboxylesterase